MAGAQSDATYYALFGENVTETLKNCIVYEGEIEAVYLKGKFGVYSEAPFKEYDEKTLCGSNFYIGAVPTKVSELVTDGFPFLRDKIRLIQTYHLPNPQVTLYVKGEYLSAKVWVNDQYAGMLFFEKRIDISDYATMGENKIEVEFTIGNRNLLGPLHKIGIEWFVMPPDFESVDLVSNVCGDMSYKLRRFYVNQVADNGLNQKIL